MDYKTQKELRKTVDKILNIVLYPIRKTVTPIYNWQQEQKKQRRYKDVQIEKAIRYMLDYWLDGEKSLIVVIDDGYNPFDYSGVHTAYSLQSDMDYGRSGEHKRMKRKLSHIYRYQKAEYLQKLQALCDTPMTDDEKKQNFEFWDYERIKDRNMFLLKSM